MAIHTLVTNETQSVSSIPHERCRFTISTGDNNGSGSFELTLENNGGRSKDYFVKGDEVSIYADDGSYPPTTKRFGGYVEDVSFSGFGQSETLNIYGRSYDSILLDASIEPEVYNNMEISAIITDFMGKYCPEITTTNVQVTTKTFSTRFNHTPIFDALRSLAAEVGFFFFVDTNKDLHFEPKGSMSSGVTLDNSNVLSGTTTNTTRGLKNAVWVYGDRILTQTPRESFVSDGVGSVYTLTYQPHNTTVTVSGVTFQGGVNELTVFPASGVQYLVDFNEQQIILTSGTQAGYNIPASGVSVLVDYYRSTPIVAQISDSNSTIKHQKPEIIVDKTITIPSQAKALAKSKLAELKDGNNQRVYPVKGLLSVNIGETVRVNLPFHNIVNEEYDVLEITYDFSPETVFLGEVQSFKLSKRIEDVTDTLKKMLLDMRKVQGSDILPTDIITRILSGTGSEGVRVSYWQVGTRLINDSFILGHNVNGRLGSQAVLQPLLGDHRSGLVVAYSGGDV